MNRTVLPVDVCVATVDRPADLAAALSCWRESADLPTRVIVVDASTGDASAEVCRQAWSPLAVRYQRANAISAARQRNQAADLATSTFVLFCDDDITFPADTLTKLFAAFADDGIERIGGIAATVDDLPKAPPSRLVRLYYRLQSGYWHEHYGGRLFGPAINRYPTDSASAPELYPAQWLNTELVLYRRQVFAAVRFPEFSGYSFGEDLALSAQISRSHLLFFHLGARYTHKASPGRHKADGRSLGEMQVRHRWWISNNLLGLQEPARTGKFFLSLLFDGLYLLRIRPRNWIGILLGSWRAFGQLAILRRSNRVVGGNPPGWGKQ